MYCHLYLALTPAKDEDDGARGPGSWSELSG